MAQKIVHKPERILVVSQHYWPESFRVNDVVDFLIEKGCAVDVLCGLPNYPKGEFMEGYGYFGIRRQVHKGARIERVLEIKRGKNTNFRIIANYLSFPFFSLFHIPRLLFRSYDHILMYETSPVMMTLPGILVGKIKRIPTTMYVLDLWPENLYSVLPLKNRFLNWLVTVHSHWYYKMSDNLVALSSQMSQKLRVVTGKSDDRIITLPQACEKIYEDRRHDNTLRERFKDTFNVVFTGNISPAQSFETMIEAAEILRSGGYANIQWVIVGDGMSRRDVEAKIAATGLDSSFIFEGQKPVEDIPLYADVADVLVGCLVKSDFLEATIPAKVMSYIALGKPIVLAMDGEVQDLINETIQCGFACETNNATKLAENIAKIYHMNEQERKAMGEKARKFHFSNFERDLVLNKLYKFMTL